MRSHIPAEDVACSLRRTSRSEDVFVVHDVGRGQENNSPILWSTFMVVSMRLRGGCLQEHGEPPRWSGWGPRGPQCRAEIEGAPRESARTKPMQASASSQVWPWASAPSRGPARGRAVRGRGEAAGVCVTDVLSKYVFIWYPGSGSEVVSHRRAWLLGHSPPPCHRLQPTRALALSPPALRPGAMPAGGRLQKTILDNTARPSLCWSPGKERLPDPLRVLSDAPARPWERTEHPVLSSAKVCWVSAFLALRELAV